MSNNQSTHEYALKHGYDNYYDFLGVPPNASETDIDAAARTIQAEVLSSQMSPEAALLKEAQRVLMDPTRRENYDQLGHEAYVDRTPKLKLTSFHPAPDSDPSPESHSSNEPAEAPSEEPPDPTPDPDAEEPSEPEQNKKGAGLLAAMFPNRQSFATVLTFIYSRVTNTVIRTYKLGKKIIRNDNDKMSGLSGRYHPEDVFTPTEEIKVQTNPTRWQSIGPYALGCLFYLFAIFSSYMIRTESLHAYINSRLIGISVPAGHIPFWWTFPLICIILGTAVIIAEMLQRASTWYVLTDNRIIVREGILSRQTPSYQIDQLSKSEEDSPFPLNLIGIGHIDLYTSAKDDREERLWYLPSSGKFRDELSIQGEKAYRGRTRATENQGAPDADD